MELFLNGGTRYSIIVKRTILDIVFSIVMQREVQDA
jgi:hypothetical protein